MIPFWVARVAGRSRGLRLARARLMNPPFLVLGRSLFVVNNNNINDASDRRSDTFR